MIAHQEGGIVPDWLASGFSLVGLAVAVLQQAPGIVRAIRPPAVDPFARNSGSAAVEILEKTFGIGSLVLIVVVFDSVPVPSGLSLGLFASAFVALAAYYALYVAYYRGSVGLPVLLGMAALPAAAFLLVALAQGNYLALITTVVFAAVHIGLTYSNFGHGRLMDPRRTS
jgi:hypothetical protein